MNDAIDTDEDLPEARVADVQQVELELRRSGDRLLRIDADHALHAVVRLEQVEDAPAQIAGNPRHRDNAHVMSIIEPPNAHRREGIRWVSRWTIHLNFHPTY